MEDRYGLIPADIRARYEREEFVDRGARAGRELDRALKALDERLECVFVHPGVPEDELPAGAIAGRWHVRRHNPPPALPSYKPILARGGGYREPDHDVIWELQDQDLRRPEVKRKVMEAGRTDGGHSDAALREEQRRDEMQADYRAARRMKSERELAKMRKKLLA